MQEQASIDLIAKLLSSETGLTDNSKNKLFEDLLKFFDKDVQESISKVNYAGKGELLRQFKSSLDRIEFFAQHPSLIGKTFIGIYGANLLVLDKSLKKLMGEGAKFFTESKNVLSFFYKDSMQRFQAVNKLGVLIELTRADFLACNTLTENAVKVSQLVDYFLLAGNNPWKNIVFVYIPKEAYGSESYNKLLGFLDGVIVGDSTYKLLQSNNISLGEHNNIYCPTYSKKDLREWLEGNNNSSFNCYDFLNLRKLLLAIASDVQLQKTHAEKLRKALQQDTVKISLLGEDEQAYEELKKRTAERQQQLQENLEIMLNLLRNLEIKLQEAEAEFIPRDISWKKLHYQAAICCLDYGVLLNSTNYKKQYLELYKLLEDTGGAYTYLLDMYVSRSFTANNLAMLKQEALNTDLVNYLKLINIEKMGETKDKEYQLIDSLKNKSLLSGEECLKLGQRYSCTSYAGRFYLQGAEKDSLACGKSLLAGLTYTTKEDIDYLKRLAYALHPDGAKAYAEYLRSQKKYYLSKIWMRIAANQGSMAALGFLAASCYRKRNESDEACRLGITLYNELISKDCNKDKCHLRIGEIYLAQENYSKAYNSLCQSNEPMAFYWRGRLKANLDDEYKGYGQNLVEAKSLLLKAQRLGANNEPSLLKRVEEFIEQRNRPKQSSKPRNYNPRKRETCREDCCFVIAATCVSLSLLTGTVNAQEVQKVLNNKIAVKALNAESLGTCRALLLYHNYRDQSLLQQDNGPRLLDEYYRLSNLLITKINQEQDSRAIYRDIYDNKILKALEAMRKKDFKQADRATIQMMVDLCQKYDIAIDESIISYLNNSGRL